MVDTGSPYTIISRELFEKSGFCVPSAPPTNLRIPGVVRNAADPEDDKAYLSGWPGVKVFVCLPHGIYGEKLKLPTVPIEAVVAENVDEDEFLLGLDFLGRFPVLLEKNLIVMLVR